MSRLDTLHKRLDQVQRSLPETSLQAEEFDCSLFPDEERTQFLSILATMPKDTREWSKVDSNQIHLFDLWLHLYKALASGNIKEQERYRRRLATSQESLIAQFMALDDGTANHRNIVLNRIQANRVDWSTIDAMWNLVEGYTGDQISDLGQTQSKR